MPSNTQKGTRWYATPNTARRRRQLQLTVDDSTRQWLREMADEDGRSMSELLDELVSKEKRRRTRLAANT